MPPLLLLRNATIRSINISKSFMSQTVLSTTLKQSMASSSVSAPPLNVKQISVPAPWGSIEVQVFGEPDNSRAIPVLCLHGYLDNSQSFRPAAPFICASNKYYMIAVDFPGKMIFQSRTLTALFCFIVSVNNRPWTEFEVARWAGLFAQVLFDGSATCCQIFRAQRFLHA